MSYDLLEVYLSLLAARKCSKLHPDSRLVCINRVYRTKSEKGFPFSDWLLDMLIMDRLVLLRYQTVTDPTLVHHHIRDVKEISNVIFKKHMY